jgi:hypothetical protein
VSIDIVARNEDKFSGLIIENTFLSLVSTHLRTLEFCPYHGTNSGALCVGGYVNFFFFIVSFVGRFQDILSFPRIKAEGTSQLLRKLKHSFHFRHTYILSIVSSLSVF